MAQQQATIPNTHGGVRGIINANATDAQTRLAKADKCRMGWADFNDSATLVTPISVTSAAGWVLLTNNKLGANTNVTYLPEGVTTALWASNQFNFSQLKVGDTVHLRVDVRITTTTNSQVTQLRVRMGIGSVVEFSIPLTPMQFKTSGTYQVNTNINFYIGSDSVRNNPARIEISSDANASVVVNGWFVETLLRGEAS